MKALIIATVSSMIYQFTRENIKSLQEIGYDVEVACNFDQCGSITLKKSLKLKEFLESESVKCHQIDFPRSPFRVIKLLKSYLQLKKISKEKFNIVHCHTPVGGMIGRFAFRKAKDSNCKIIYTAHGFHFYKGAPLFNWLFYYPIEKLCSRWTDVLITINKEDFELAKKKMHAKTVKYIKGVGIDVERINNISIDKDAKRKEIGVPKDSKLLISVGELNKNKNHRSVIRAISRINDNKIYYVIAGIGKEYKSLKKLAASKNVNLLLLGYRNDVVELYKCSDLYIHPSFREGLPVALMEALASGINCICSNIRGCNDLVRSGLFNPRNINEIECLITKTNRTTPLNIGKNIIEEFDIKTINNQMLKVYKGEGDANA